MLDELEPTWREVSARRISQSRVVCVDKRAKAKFRAQPQLECRVLFAAMFKFVQSRQKRKDVHRDEDESATEDEFSGSASGSGSGSGSESESDSEQEEAFGEEPEGSVLTASEIIASPLVPDDEDEDITRCLICPGKLLKSPKMVQVHESSHVSAAFYI